MLVSALHYRFSTHSTAVYCRYPSDPIYKYLLTYATAKYEELAIEIWLACRDSVSCLYICIHACTHRCLLLSTCSSIYPSVHLCVTPSTPPPICILLSIRPFSSQSVCMSFCISVYRTIDTSNNPSIQLLIHLK